MDPDVPPLYQPQAQLERHPMDDYLLALGHDPDGVRTRSGPAAPKVLTEAAQYAAFKLTEVESRAHFVPDLHDGRR
jgi:hypothetical protein